MKVQWLELNYLNESDNVRFCKRSWYLSLNDIGFCGNFLK